MDGKIDCLARSLLLEKFSYLYHLNYVSTAEKSLKSCHRSHMSVIVVLGSNYSRWFLVPACPWPIGRTGQIAEADHG